MEAGRTECWLFMVIFISVVDSAFHVATEEVVGALFVSSRSYIEDSTPLNRCLDDINPRILDPFFAVLMKKPPGGRSGENVLPCS